MSGKRSRSPTSVEARAVTTETYDQRPKRRYGVRAEMMIRGLEGAALERDDETVSEASSGRRSHAAEQRRRATAGLDSAGEWEGLAGGAIPSLSRWVLARDRTMR